MQAHSEYSSETYIQRSFRQVISKTVNIIAELTRRSTLFHYFLLMLYEIFFATINYI